jgi:hypothetical protein
MTNTAQKHIRIFCFVSASWPIFYLFSSQVTDGRNYSGCALYIPVYSELTIFSLLRLELRPLVSRLMSTASESLSKRLPSTCGCEATSGPPGFTYITFPRQHKLVRCLEALGDAIY